MKEEGEKMKMYFSIISILFLALSGILLSDGIVVPIFESSEPSHYTPFIIEYHHVKVEIKNDIALIEIEESFKNTSNSKVQAQYVFPLIGETYVTDFEMIVGDKIMKPVVLEKDEARKLYMEIVRRMKDPALLEFANFRTLTLKVYPFEPNESRRIILKYVQLLNRNANIHRFDYPLKIEGTLLEPMKNVKIEITIQCDEPIKDVYSPNFEFDIIRKRKKEVQLVFEKSTLYPADDLTLFYETGEDALDISTMFYCEDEEKFFMLSVLPPKLSEEKALSKNIVIVMDISGSMHGEKIEQAKRAVEYILKNLGEGDMYSLVFFNQDVIDLTDGKLLPSPNIQNILNKVRKIDAGGGTNIFDALKHALNILKGKYENENFIIFVTDGLPTVGLKEPRKIVEKLNDFIVKNEIDVRIFTFGVGYDVNTYLLDSLSVKNGGYAEYVVENSRLDDAIQKFYEKVRTPILRDVTIDTIGIHTYDLHPSKIHNIFSNSSIRIFGKYEGCGKAKIILKGLKRDGRELVKQWMKEFPCSSENNFFIAQVWAQKKISDLILKAKLGELRFEDVKDEIIYLSKKYGIINEFTSYLIIPKDEFGKIPMSMESGKKAVKFSKSLFSLKTESTVRSANAKDFKDYKLVEGKVFVLKNDFWVDLDFKGENIVKVKFLSDAYMKLIEDEKLARYLSIGEKLKVNYKGIDLVICENGIEKIEELPDEFK